MDWKSLVSAQRLGGEISENYNQDKRNIQYSKGEFEKDYHRIVSSASFRRLQDKTQVFPLDKSDFVRTRLTHSLETSSYARTLGKMVSSGQNQYSISNQDPKAQPYMDKLPEILMCAGLLHDIGNPPFGHFGETVIGDWFKRNLDNPAYLFAGEPLGQHLTEQMKADLCNFEGNAQALRLLTKLHFLDNDKGVNLTVSVLNTLVKYPTPSTHIQKEPKNIKNKKMGYFYADQEVYKDIALNTGTLIEGEDCILGKRHPLTYLLESADDISYATADLEDGFKKRMFGFDQLIQFVESKQQEYQNQMIASQEEKTTLLFAELKVLKANTNTGANGIKKNVENIELHAIQNWLLYVQDWLMYCSAYGFTSNYQKILEGNYKNDLFHGTFHEYSMQILKDVMREFIFPSAKILKLELAAQTILSSLLDKFIPAILYYGEDFPHEDSEASKKFISLISENYKEAYKLEIAQYHLDTPQHRTMRLYLRLLLITDFISGMTDSYAKTIYQELNGIY